MKKMMLLIALIAASACSSVNVRTDGQKEAMTPPTFQKSYTFWWWGLKGQHSINVREVCAGAPVKQMQTVDTVSNILSAVFTLGIYSPRTARVWCDEVKK